MSAAIPFIMMASAVVGAISAINQGNAAKSAADYNAQINAQNAQIARNDAAAQAAQQDRLNLLRIGSIHAAQGAAGGAAGSGSVLDVLGDVAAQGELEKQNIIYQGEQRARGYSNTANLDTFSGKAAQTAGYMKAGTELIGGAASSYKAYSSLTNAGTGSGYSDFIKGYTPENYG